MSVTEDVEENSQFVAMSFLARLSALVFQILVYDFFVGKNEGMDGGGTKIHTWGEKRNTLTTTTGEDTES